MKIFFKLFLANLLTDFVLQTNFIASWKKRSSYGVLVHSFTFFILGLSVVILYIDRLFYTNSVAYEFFQKKMYSIIFRVIIMLLFLLPNKLYLLSLFFIPLMWILNKRVKFLSPISWWVNTIVVYSFGIGIYLIQSNFVL